MEIAAENWEQLRGHFIPVASEAEMVDILRNKTEDNTNSLCYSGLAGGTYRICAIYIHTIAHFFRCKTISRQHSKTFHSNINEQRKIFLKRYLDPLFPLFGARIETYGIVVTITSHRMVLLAKDFVPSIFPSLPSPSGRTWCMYACVYNLLTAMCSLHNIEIGILVWVSELD